MKLNKYFFIPLILFISCVDDKSQIQNDTENLSPVNNSIAQDSGTTDPILPIDSFFKEIDTNFAADQLILPENFKTKILFSQTIDSVVRKDGLKFPAKGNHDMIAYIPINGSSKHGWLYVSHETHNSNLNR